jgi:hypothetical protein
MIVFLDVGPCSLVEALDVSEVLAASIITFRVIALMKETTSTSEMSVNFYQTTWPDIPEDSHLHTHRHENLKSFVSCVMSDCLMMDMVRSSERLAQPKYYSGQQS